jgi:hypothetical protein
MALYDNTPTGPTYVTGESFAAALNDPVAKQLVEDSVAYFEKLQAEGRDHSVPPFVRSKHS